MLYSMGVLITGISYVPVMSSSSNTASSLFTIVFQTLDTAGRQCRGAVQGGGGGGGSAGGQ